MTDAVADGGGLPDVPDVRAPASRVLLAGLSVAAATMLVAVMFMVLILRSPELMLLVGPLVVVFVVTAGLPVGWATWRLTNGMGLRHLVASVVFFGVGAVAGLLWGYAIFSFVTRWQSAALDADLSAALPWVGALYTASVAGMGAFAGRFLGPWAATRPSLVRWCTVTVLLVAAIGVALLTLFGRLDA